MGVIMPAVRVAPTAYEAHLPHSSVSVRQARAKLAQDLSERDVLGTVVDDAILILSEFVTNALRHARALTSDTIRVYWSLSGEGLLRIEVTGKVGSGHFSAGPRRRTLWQWLTREPQQYAITAG